ncbi:MAG: LytTR family DNA-binding domain-containing protein [Minisyncoccales bacterium]
MADMITAIDKACDAIHESDYQKKIEILLSNAASSTSSKMVVFPTLEINQATPLSSILFGEAVAGGCIMHLDSNKDFFIPIPLRHYEQLFNNHGFFRCHPFFVVNLKRIQRIDKESSLIHLDNSMKLPFEQRKYALLTERCHETGSAEY